VSVRPSVGLLVCLSVRNAFFLVGRDEPANDLFRVYKLAAICFFQLDGGFGSFVGASMTIDLQHANLKLK